MKLNTVYLKHQCLLQARALPLGGRLVETPHPGGHHLLQAQEHPRSGMTLLCSWLNMIYNSLVLRLMYNTQQLRENI